MYKKYFTEHYRISSSSGIITFLAIGQNYKEY